MKIIFIRNDIRSAYQIEKHGKQVMTNITPVLQVYKKTLKRYKVGDYLSLKLDKQPYAFGGTAFKKKIYYLEETVLAQVHEIVKNVIKVDIVK